MRFKYSQRGALIFMSENQNGIAFQHKDNDIHSNDDEAVYLVIGGAFCVLNGLQVG